MPTAWFSCVVALFKPEYLLQLLHSIYYMQKNDLLQKWHLLLGEKRKKREMFSHKLLGPDEIKVLAGGAG